MSRRNVVLLLGVLAGLAGLAGCGAQSKSTDPARYAAEDYYFQGRHDEAIAIHAAAAAEADSDFVMVKLQQGYNELAAGRDAEAAASFYAADREIEATGNNTRVRMAASIITNKRRHVWKGDLHEQVAAAFYHGVARYRLGEYDNARGAFEKALMRIERWAGRRQVEGERDRLADVETADLHALAKAVQAMLARSLLATGDRAEAARLLAAVYDVQDEAELEKLVAAHEAANATLVIDAGVGPRRHVVYEPLHDGQNGHYVPWRGSRKDSLRTSRQKVHGYAPPARGRPGPPQVTLNHDPAAPPVVQDNFDLVSFAEALRWGSDGKDRRGSWAEAGVNASRAVSGLFAGSKARDNDFIVAGSQFAEDEREWALPRAVVVVPLALPAGTHQVGVTVAEDRPMLHGTAGIHHPHLHTTVVTVQAGSDRPTLAYLPAGAQGPGYKYQHAAAVKRMLPGEAAARHDAKLAAEAAAAGRASPVAAAAGSADVEAAWARQVAALHEHANTDARILFVVANATERPMTYRINGGRVRRLDAAKGYTKKMTYRGEDGTLRTSEQPRATLPRRLHAAAVDLPVVLQVEAAPGRAAFQFRPTWNLTAGVMYLVADRLGVHLATVDGDGLAALEKDVPWDLAAEMVPTFAGDGVSPLPLDNRIQRQIAPVIGGSSGPDRYLP